MQKSGLLAVDYREGQTSPELLSLPTAAKGLNGHGRRRIGLVQSHCEVVNPVCTYLEASNRFQLSHCYSSTEQAVQDIPACPPDAVLIALSGSQLSSLECLHHLRRALPKRPPLIVLSPARELPVYVASFQAGADGFFVMPGTAESFELTLSDALAGWKPVSSEMHNLIVDRLIRTCPLAGPGGTLSPAEQRVLSGLVLNLQDKEIADLRGTSAGTIHSITTSIFKKLGVHSRGAAVKMFLDSFQKEPNTSNPRRNSARATQKINRARM